ncbi:fibronectin type III domain-containing protein [Acetobacterium wieringae]|uniref:Neutral metalloprotease n=1 Tax=Acetobacterium wieringae TaxID=52694 RepID=A0A1F2PEH0_9FIRM|nr:fibronectin type III domain-containing protein [Acetobacterium wieringae]OFV69046.1 neutral metalloprotease precursor [Acetobacterium wieringae]
MKSIKRNVMILAMSVLILLFSTIGVSAATLETEAIGVQYRGHVQNKGDMPQPVGTMVKGPDALGTRGESLRVEGFWIELTGDVPEGAAIKYQVHVQNEGWMTPEVNGAFAGTHGKSQRVESIRISLENLPGYDVYYRGHVQNVGDVPQVNGDWGWKKNGEELGTTGSSLRLEELQIKIVKQSDVTYDKAGTYGPKTGEEVVHNNVVINTPDVTLQNMHITGDLTIGEGVGEGDVTLNNITVDGDTFIRGGGKNSIHINGGDYNKITVQQTSSGQVRIVATDATGLEVVISEDAGGEDIILEGAFENVQVDAPDVKISTQGDTTIKQMNMGEAAKGSEVTLGSDTKVENLVLDAEVDVKGQGTVEKAKVNSDGITFEKAPVKQDVAPDVETPPVITPPAEKPPVTPPGTPGGGSGGGTPTTTAIIGVSITGDQNVGSTLTATPNPTNGTGTYQWMRSATPIGTYEAIIGATSKTYVLQSGDATKFIKVVITGNGSYTGTQTSVATSAITNLKEITAFTPLTPITLSSNENLTDLASLKASSKLPTQVTVTDGSTPASATITNWIGTFDGTTTGAKTLTAVWTMPTGYRDQTIPITVQITVNVNTAQTTVSSSAKVITGTTIGTLDAGNITAVPVGTKVKTLKDGLTLSPDATCEIVASSDPGALAVTDQENTNVTGTMVIKVTAQDNSIAMYTITMAPVVKSTTPTAGTTTVAKTAQTQASVGFTLTSSHSVGAWKVFSNADCTTAATGVSATLSGSTLTLAHATDLPAATYYVVYNDGTHTDSEALALTVGAYEANLVDVLKNPRFEASNGTSSIYFDQPTDKTGIQNYQIMFSSDNGLNWDYTAQLSVANEGTLSLDMSALAINLNETKAFNKVKVISNVAENSDYQQNETSFAIDFTITKEGSELAIAVARNESNDVEITLSENALDDETYAIRIFGASGVGASSTITFKGSYITDNVITMSHATQPISGLSEGAVFKVCKINKCTTTGLSVTPMQATGVTINNTPPALSSEKAITATTVGTLTGGNITALPVGTKVSALKADLTVSDEATVEIITGTGGSVVADQANVDVTPDMKIEVTAQDNSKAEYTIAMGAVGIASNPQITIVSESDTFIKYDAPTNMAGISAFEIMFSKDAGSTWENKRTVIVDQFFTEWSLQAYMSVVSGYVNETTTYNKMKVISKAKAGYQQSENPMDLNYTITKTGEALAITATRNAEGKVEIKLPAEKTTNETYIYQILNAEGSIIRSDLISVSAAMYWAANDTIVLPNVIVPSNDSRIKISRITGGSETGLNATPLQTNGVGITEAPTLSDEKAITATSVGTLSGGNITAVPVGTKVSALKAGLTVSPNAICEIMTTNAPDAPAVTDQENTDVTALMVIKVTAQDNSLASYSIAMAPTLDAPLNLQVATGNGTATLQWDAVADAVSYKVYQSSTSGGVDYSEIANAVTATSYQATGLTPGKTYYFVVKAVAAGYSDSPASSEVTAIANIDLTGNSYSGNKLVVTNESLSLATQSTGALSNITMDTQIIDGLDQGAYRINPEIPVTQAPGEPLVNSSMESNMTLANVNDERNFYTYNYQTQQYETITTRCAYVGIHSEIWVDKNEAAGTTLTAEEAQTLAAEFDQNIYDLIITNFYAAPDVNNDAKVAILVFDIKDGYAGSGGYVGGYFNGNDLYDRSNSNQLDMIYVDTYPLIGTEKNLANSYSTMAHEFQHMVNFNCNKDQGGQMETWLNEALSLAAEHLYEGVQSSRISYYNNSTPIADGRSVMDWNNSDSLPNYALSYLFSQYLRTQAEAKLGEGIKTDIYQQIIADPGDTNTALSNAIKANIDADMTTEKFMTNFRVAMVLKANSGSYSFGKDAASFSGVTTKLSTQTSADLKGGGAIVKGISGSFTAPDLHGDTITFTGVY